ncbi:MAG: potassium channel family protein [Woeseiaceae bacterium]|nr:potassium channel family protein [Woeseiaceae bacterium]
MIRLSLVGAALVAVTIVIQAGITTWWLQVLSRYRPLQRSVHNRWTNMRVLASTGVVLLAMHLLQILTWATTYRWLVPGDELQTFEKAVYFSFVTFTTLGYGDITLSESYRMLSGIQAMNGILLVGWSTAVLFAIVQRIWSLQVQQDTQT